MLRSAGAAGEGWIERQSITSRKNEGWIALSASRTPDQGSGSVLKFLLAIRFALNSVRPTASPGPPAAASAPGSPTASESTWRSA